MTAFRKNQSKVEMHRLPPDALLEEAKVWTVGAIKYPDSPDGTANWEKLWGDKTLAICLDSLMRHTLAIQRGEVRDPETGLPHAAHARCNLAMIIRYQLQQEELHPALVPNTPHI